MRDETRFIRSVLKLRAEGWHDWQLLGAIKILGLRYRFNQIPFNFKKKLDFRNYLVEKSKESEKASDPIVPVSHFQYTNLRSELDIGERTLKDQFYFSRSDDIEHLDPFKFTLEPILEEWSKNYEISIKQERDVLLDLEILWGKPIPNIDLIESEDIRKRKDGFISKDGHVIKLSLYNLKRLPESIENLKFLQELKLDGLNLECLPDTITNLRSLKILDLMGCGNLRSIPLNLGNLKSLAKLKLRGHLKALPERLGELKNLKSLEITDMSSLKALPNSIGNLKTLEKLEIRNPNAKPPSIRNVPIESIPVTIGNLQNLKVLNLSECRSLKSIPESIGNLSSLEILDLGEYDKELLSIEKNKLKVDRFKKKRQIGRPAYSLPVSLGNLKSLKILNLSFWKSLKSLPESISKLINLEELNLKFCDSLINIPESLGELKSLKILNLKNCISLKSIPDSVGDLNSLETIDLDGCRLLDSLPKSLGNLKGIKSISIRNCNFKDVPNPVINLNRYRSIEVSGNPIGKYNNYFSMQMEEKIIDTLPKTPDKIYDDFLNKKLTKNKALEKLLSLIEISNSIFVQIRSIELIQLLDIASEKLFSNLENILISYENPYVRAISAMILISLFKEKCEKPIRWAIENIESGIVITSIFKSLELLEKKFSKSLKKYILEIYSEKYGVCLDEAIFFLDLEALKIYKPYEVYIWNPDFKVGHWSIHRCSFAQFSEGHDQFECGYVVSDDHVILLDLTYWNINKVPKSIGLLSELKDLKKK